MKVYVHGNGHLAEITTAHVASLGHACLVAHEADVIWCCEDVNSVHHVPRVLEDIHRLVHMRPTALFLISSQLPVGTIGQLEKEFPRSAFACCPENFRAVDTAEAYLEQARFVVGVRDMAQAITLRPLFPLISEMECMSVESAEMVKHTVNAYLGLCIAFINEIRDVCAVVGADIVEVESGLRTEPRVSPLAPLHAGEPFGWGHIDRDLTYLRDLHRTVLIEAIHESNHSRRR
jgi:UDPglucose 6-dehydrogenase